MNEIFRVPAMHGYPSVIVWTGENNVVPFARLVISDDDLAACMKMDIDVLADGAVVAEL